MMNNFLILNFRFWAESQTIEYFESEALLLHVHSWTPKLILKNYLSKFELSKNHKNWKSDPQIIQNVIFYEN